MAKIPPVPSPVDEKRAGFEREALVHLDVLYRVALRLTGNPSDADDLVQETMLKAYRAWDQYEKGTNAKAWLLTILRHAFINEYRRKTRHPETVDLDSIEPFAVFPEVQDEDPQGAFFDRIVLKRSGRHWCSATSKACRTRRSPGFSRFPWGR